MGKQTKSKRAMQVVQKPAGLSDYKQQSLSIEKMIMEAIKGKVPVETMERVLAMRDTLKKEFAKEAFDKAMADFQMECPVIEKTKEVFDKAGKLRYKFPPLGSIIKQTKDIIAKCGLSYRFQNEIKDKTMIVNCIVTHISGHSELSPFTVNIGEEQYMTDVQKYGARDTFAKRYAFCNAFGIMTGDEDNENNLKVENPQVNESIEKLGKCTTKKSFNKVWDSLPKEIKASVEVLKQAKMIKDLIREAKQIK